MSVKSYILNREEFEKGKYLNKFMPLERALNLLNSQTLWFANPEIWTDPYEKKFLCADYGDGRQFPWRNRIFCACFTNNASSEASWNAYSKDEICVRFTFRRKELMNVFEEYLNGNQHNQMYFDKVEYMQTKNIDKALSKIPFDPDNIKKRSLGSMEFKTRLLLLKRRAFEYEQEFRAIIVKPKATKESGIKVKIPNINALINSITIGPKVGEDTYKMLRVLFQEKYNFDKKAISQSLLYKSSPKNMIAQ